MTKETLTTMTITLTKEHLFEMLCSLRYGDLFDVVRYIDIEVAADYEFTEICARYFIQEMSKLKEDDDGTFNKWVEFLKEVVEQNDSKE